MPENYPIDLGREMPGAIAAPSSEGYGSLKKGGPDMSYPTLYLDSDQVMDLPDDGTMTIRFHKTSETVTDREGKKTQCCTLEVREILSTKGEAGSKSAENPGDRLDALRAEIESMKEDMAEGSEE